MNALIVISVIALIVWLLRVGNSNKPLGPVGEFVRLLGGIFAAFATFVLGVLGELISAADKDEEYAPLGKAQVNYRTGVVDEGVDPGGIYEED